MRLMFLNKKKTIAHIDLYEFAYLGTWSDPVTQSPEVPVHSKQDLTVASLDGMPEAMKRRTRGNICILISI